MAATQSNHHSGSQFQVNLKQIEKLLPFPFDLSATEANQAKINKSILRAELPKENEPSASRHYSLEDSGKLVELAHNAICLLDFDEAKLLLARLCRHGHESLRDPVKYLTACLHYHHGEYEQAENYLLRGGIKDPRVLSAAEYLSKQITKIEVFRSGLADAEFLAAMQTLNEKPFWPQVWLSSKVAIENLITGQPLKALAIAEKVCAVFSQAEPLTELNRFVHLNFKILHEYAALLSDQPLNSLNSIVGRQFDRYRSSELVAPHANSSKPNKHSALWNDLVATAPNYIGIMNNLGVELLERAQRDASLEAGQSDGSKALAIFHFCQRLAEVFYPSKNISALAASLSYHCAPRVNAADSLIALGRYSTAPVEIDSATELLIKQVTPPSDFTLATYARVANTYHQLWLDLNRIRKMMENGSVSKIEQVHEYFPALGAYLVRKSGYLHDRPIDSAVTVADDYLYNNAASAYITCGRIAEQHHEMASYLGLTRKVLSRNFDRLLNSQKPEPLDLRPIRFKLGQ